jgi:hypothetical protein
MSKSKRPWPAILVAAFIPTFLLSYGGAYVVMQSKTAQTGTNGSDAFTVRYYSADWHVVLFRPLAEIESVLRNHEIQLQYVP